MSAFRVKPQSKAEITKGSTIVGKRIPESTPLGKTLAQLRLQYAMASEVTMPQEDLRRRMMETSLNVEAPLDLLAANKAREQRARLIREHISRFMESFEAQNGQPPNSVGVPRDSYDEIKAACDGYLNVTVCVMT